MEYLYLIWEGGQAAEPSDRGEVMRDMLAYVGQLALQGKLLGGGPLQPAPQARTVRERSGEVTVTDGPYCETKEVVGGYFLVEADSLAEAVELAKSCPAAAYGGIEVRQLLHMS